MQEIQELLLQTAQQQAMTALNIDRLERSVVEVLNITTSSARSIQAWEARIEENRVEAEEERSELRVATANLQAAVNELIQANRQNTIEHELFRRRFEAIDPLLDAE